MKTKQDLRAHYRQERKHLTEEQRQDMSRSIVQHYLSLFAQEKPKVLHLFLPIVRLQEVNMWVLLERINTDYPQVKTVTSMVAPDQVSLLTVEVRHGMNVIENAWGIPEPAEQVFCDPLIVDEVLTPLLAMDEQGTRLGYGKGFYDRFFSLCSPGVKKTGLNYFKPVHDKIPKDAWDVPLDRLVHPDGVSMV
jgi:5-formyltetrahydrofolate cyclo-ligase